MAIWNIDSAHTNASFSVKHMGLLNVRGHFDSTTGTVATNVAGDLEKIEATISVKTISTRDKDRDGHLLGEDFFHAERYPNITFKSTNVKKVNANLYVVKGDLTIRGVTKQVELEATVGNEIKDPFGFRRVAIETSTVINRKDFGIIWNQVMDNGGVVVGEQVKITIESEIVTK